MAYFGKSSTGYWEKCAFCSIEYSVHLCCFCVWGELEMSEIWILNHSMLFRGQWMPLISVVFDVENWVYWYLMHKTLIDGECAQETMHI